MPNRMDLALDTHRQRIDTTAGDTCVYIRARFRIKDVRCVLGQSDFVEANNELEGVSEIKVIDFLLDPRDLKIGGDAVEPQRGDKIEHGGEVYDLMPGVSGTMWRWTDSRKVWYRVHTDRRRVQSK